MKFYEFNDFAYYALIGAENEGEAIDYYVATVADIENSDGEPLEVPRKKAKDKLLAICRDDNEAKQAEIEFEELTKGLEPYLILIDSSLL